MRTIKIKDFPEMTVKEAKDLVDLIKYSICKLPKAKPPVYEGPSLEELKPAIFKTIKAALKSLRRENPPREGRVTQHGVSIDVLGWELSLSNWDDNIINGDGLHINIATEVLGLNEDGDVEPIKMKKGFLEELFKITSEAVGEKPINEWQSNTWISMTFNVSPGALKEAYARYKPFESHPGHQQFRDWFENGVRSELEDK